MSAQILNGRIIAEEVTSQVAKEVIARQQRGKRVPALAVVLVGENPASALYVRNKKRECERVGIRSLSYNLPATISEADLLSLVHRLNNDTLIDGILVQLPLPKHINVEKVVELIDPYKDVDGLHPYNMGRLALKMPLLRPCTPRGVMKLLEHTGTPIEGQDVVVVGVSNLVGRPMLLELLLARATVTACHSKTDNLPDKVFRADIVIVGVGQPNFISGEWIKPGAIVVDIGINRLPNGALCGDVDHAAARERASWITPVPGGVGPMTVAILMQNTLVASTHFAP